MLWELTLQPFLMIRCTAAILPVPVCRSGTPPSLFRPDSRVRAEPLESVSVLTSGQAERPRSLTLEPESPSAQIVKREGTGELKAKRLAPKLTNALPCNKNSSEEPAA